MPASTPRTRVIFQNVNVHVGPAALSGNTATGQLYSAGNAGNNLIAPLANVTQATVSVGINRQDLNVLGRLNRVGQIIISPPNISLDFAYNITDGYNEKMLGLNTNGGAFLSGIMTKISDSKNYFLSLSQQGEDDDDVTNPNVRDVLAIGNGFLSNYTFNAAVGQVATANVTVDGLNIVAYTGSSGLQTPAVNPANSARISTWNFQLPPGETIAAAGDVYALRPGDVSVSFPAGAGFLAPLAGDDQVNLQSITLTMPIGRQILDKLGAPLGFSREIQFPLNCQLQLRALQTEFATGSFDNVLCNDNFYDGTIKVKQPSCPGVEGNDAVIFQINQFKPTNVSFGFTVGGDATVDIEATAQLAGSNSLDGITFSGYYGG